MLLKKLHIGIHTQQYHSLFHRVQIMNTLSFPHVNVDEGPRVEGATHT